ncbi:MAG: DUF1016 N-terminal domain-containing protein [Candidatus Omnitrophota bacterium]
MKKNKLVKRVGESQSFYERVRKIIEDARGNIARAINTEMVIAYWQIGKVIVEEEQRGKLRAGYGEEILKKISVKLTADFGKGFDESNLRNIRYFYLCYPKRDALRHELSWGDKGTAPFFNSSSTKQARDYS